MKKNNPNIIKAGNIISNAKRVTAFTGAGISVESGIPPFRGENGLWNRYDPIFLDINYFNKNPLESWKLIKEIFYDFFGKADPNPAHFGLAEMEKNGFLSSIITQNIDNLHQEAGSRVVHEFHGTAETLRCVKCSKSHKSSTIDFLNLPPLCTKCKGLLKPDFVFFGEPIPHDANMNSLKETEISDLFILVGTTGEIMPASMIPHLAKKKGAYIIEINIMESNFTSEVTDLFLQGKASEIISDLAKVLIEG